MSLRVSVVVPLVDSRGTAEEAIVSWLDQRSARNPFEIVVIENGQRPALTRRVSQRLGASDQVVNCRSTNEATLYNAGADAARGDLLVFSEAHAVSRRGAVAAIREYFTGCSDEAAVLAMAHRTPSLLSRLDAHLFDLEAPAVRAMGLWRCVGLRGFAIRAGVFRQLGRFVEAYGRFAETALAVRLDAAGCKIGYIPEAVVTHVDTGALAHLYPALKLGARGECEWWRREPALARRYFGATAPWSEELAPPAEVARGACLDLLRLLRHERDWADRRAIFHLLIPLIRAAWPSGQRWLARLQAGLAELRLSHSLASLRCFPHGERTALVRLYLQLRRAYVRCGVLESLAGRALGGDAARSHQKLFAISELGNECLVGFFPEEKWQGASYRWSGPVGMILLPIGEACRQIRLDIRPTGTWAVRHPRLYLNGQPIPTSGVSETAGELTLDLPEGMLARGPWQRLSFACEPFVPARHGLPDRRVLGVALIALRVQGAATPLVRAA